MAGGNNGATLREVHRLFAEGTVSGLSETQLLERFLARRDEVAFEALVSRHGPMVLGVCRRLLRDPHAIDDAFQATFLILVRKARSLRAPQLLGPWLHGVAYRVALRSRTVAARRSSREAPYTEIAVVPEDDFDNDIRPVIDEELSRLPERYREALVLCYLEGHTHDEAAERLRCPVGTVRSRLARGRERLRHRLTRRGLAPAAGFLAAEVLVPRASAAVPPILMHTTIAAATRYAAGKILAAGAVSASAAALTQGVLTTMFLSKLQVVAVGVLILGLAGGGARFAAQHGALAAQAPDGPEVVDQPKQQAAPTDDLALLQGVWKITEMVPNKLSDHWEIWKFQDSNLSMGLQGNFEEQRIDKHVRLDQESSPKRMTILHPSAEENPKATVNAIYQLEGDQLRVLMAIAGQPFPTGFADRSRSLYIVFKRSKAKASVTPGAAAPAAPAVPANAPPLSQPINQNPPAPAAAPPEEPKPESMTVKALRLRLKSARMELKRFEDLYKRQSIPLSILNEMRSKVDIVEAQIDSEQERLSDELELMEPRLEVKQAELRVAEAQLFPTKLRLTELANPPGFQDGEVQENLVFTPAVRSMPEFKQLMAAKQLEEAQRDVKKAELREAEVRMRQIQRKRDQIERLKKEVEQPKP